MGEYDIAVVGYGPTGMTLAALLGQAGHRVIVLERYRGLYNLPRAACFDDETMRTFQKLGVAEEVGRGSVVQRDYEWLNGEGETLLEIQYDDPAPAGWAALNMMYQPDVETALDEAVKALPTVDVRQGVTVTQIAQDDACVTIMGVGQQDENVEVKARYAVGADGGGGFMRRTLPGSVYDYDFSENWLVCDFRLHREVAGLPMFRQVCDPVQPKSIVRIGPHNHRFSFMLDPGVTAEEATDEANVWSRVGEFLGKDDAELIRVANYAFRSRLVTNWRHDKVFLAGDAAHEMPPFLGQGMCSGIRDSHNLAWKLDLVLRGLAADALLDTYQAEREPHVRFITEKAVELGGIQTLRDPDAARARDERLLAARRIHKRPDKLRLPPLTGRLAAGEGAFFPQGRICADRRKGLFDDVVGAGWSIVAAGPGVVEGLAPDRRAVWSGLGGRSGGVGSPEVPGGFEDIDGVYADWFARHGCAAVVMRPDWYLFGSAQDGAQLDTLLVRLAEELGAETPAEQSKERSRGRL